MNQDVAELAEGVQQFYDNLRRLDFDSSAATEITVAATPAIAEMILVGRYGEE